MSNCMKRYEKLRLKEALNRSYHYPDACRELSLILRLAYKYVPKDIQSIIFRDTLDAFRLLPQMQTWSADSAAQLLVQSAEAALPKQKKNLAVKEFKQAKVALSRRPKVKQEEEGSFELPHDVLVLIFSFLDMQALLLVALVCRSWKLAASNNQLWQSQYAIFFPRNSMKLSICNLRETPLYRGTSANTNVDWKDAFKLAYTGNSPKRLVSNRVYCGRCVAVVWADNMRCSNRDCQLRSKGCQFIPLSAHQVVQYLKDGSLSVSSSDSDSDEDEGFFWSQSY